MKGAVLALLLLTALPARAEQFAAPVAFGAMFDAEVTVSIRRFRAEAQEVWHIAGTCAGAEGATVIRLTDFPANADLTVFLGAKPAQAHRVICVTNPDRAPDAVRDLLP
ncbi:hypothetical protein SAMN06297129_0032 [Pseudooceanicola antarcticus]|uniref:Uncharacterized protein n=1 Tax=Pseudooceanicola antarcticus TaxID=1247613 RepID=A0A285HLF5_9RHOB|nr:hypothetical protein SAMN06297129_0032 [Pseudooceanicola antarcticus]